MAGSRTSTPISDKWEWQGEWDLGETGFPIIGYDVNNDGKMDLIYGRGHSYGLYWLEQQGDAATRRWVKHTIDESFSQVHALAHGGYRWRWPNGAARRQTLPRPQWRRSRLVRSAGRFTTTKSTARPGEFTRYPDFTEWNRRGRHAVHRGGSGWGWRHRHRHRGQDRRAFLRKPESQSGAERAAGKRIVAEQQDWPFPGEGAAVEWQRQKK